MTDNVFNSVRNTVKNWWISLLIGSLSIVVGVWCLVTPVSSIMALTWLFIAVLIVNGVFAIVFAVSNRSLGSGWGWNLAGGILELLLGIMLMGLPVTYVAAVLIYLIGFWMLFGSVMGIGQSCELHSIGIKGWGWLLALSIISLILSFVYLMSPIFAGMFLIAFISISFLVYGIFRIALGLRFRQVNKELKKIL